jgi:twitching motility protein PilT
MLASTLKAAISQRLVPRVDGAGRAAVAEVLVVTGRVQDLILNPNETGKITEVIAEGSYYGMQTFDQALLRYVMDGVISEEVAMETASSPHDFKLMLAAGGQSASGIEQVMGNGSPPREDDANTVVEMPKRPAPTHFSS